MGDGRALGGDSLAALSMGSSADELQTRPTGLAALSRTNALSTSALLTLVNARKIEQQQQQLDRHASALASLEQQVGAQRTVICRMLHMCLRLRDLLQRSAASQRRILRWVGVLHMQLAMLRRRVVQHAAYKESRSLLQVSTLWRMRTALVRNALLALLCHGSLAWTQAYSVSDALAGILLGAALSRRAVRTAQTGARLAVLAASVALLGQYWRSWKPGFPLNLLLQ